MEGREEALRLQAEIGPDFYTREAETKRSVEAWRRRSVETQLEEAKKRLSEIWPDDPDYEKVHDEVHRLTAEAYYLRERTE